MTRAMTRAVKRAGRVTEHERERAMRRDSDISYAVAIGRSAALAFTRRLERAVLARASEGRDVRPAVVRAFEDLREVLVQAMVYGRLRGIERETKDVGRLPQRYRPSGERFELALSPAYRRGTRFLLRRLRLPASALDDMARHADAHVVRVLATASEYAQRELMHAVAEIHAKGLNVRDGTAAIRNKLDALGLTPRSSNQAETLFRTQIQLAYAAGSAEVLADPDIDDILWGYKYVTAGDDRVRSSHWAMDGTTLPKDDPFWDRNKPPNGYNCRCQLIPIYEERTPVRPPEEVQERTASGEWKSVRVGADDGFAFDPGRLLPA